MDPVLWFHSKDAVVDVKALVWVLKG